MMKSRGFLLKNIPFSFINEEKNKKIQNNTQRVSTSNSNMFFRL